MTTMLPTDEDRVGMENLHAEIIRLFRKFKNDPAALDKINAAGGGEPITMEHIECLLEASSEELMPAIERLYALFKDIKIAMRDRQQKANV